MSRLIPIIVSDDPALRDRSLEDFCEDASLDTLLEECSALDRFRRDAENLYERVRALFFLYAIHRFHLPRKPELPRGGLLPFDGYRHLLQRRFEEAINAFQRLPPGDAVSSALAAAYRSLAFQTLSSQVRRSVRSARGNQWMFRIGHPADHPLKVRPELLPADGQCLAPLLRERTPVRMDLSHSGWSDIFFLGMDFPEGARVLNVSIDLSVRAASGEAPAEPPRPPVECYFRVIDRPVLRLVSVDLGAEVEIGNLAEVFDFARDYLGLLKAAVIASGLVPSGMEGSEQPLSALLARVAGPGRGIELVSQVCGIPKGSRLAVSTNLLASLIAVCMRATGQTRHLTGPLDENERRVVAARAILGEWLGGSGGGWQDSGGVWPGIKLIHGVPAVEGDPEWGVSRGRLLPDHRIFGPDDVSAEVRKKLQDSLVLVHGGMAQDVGPILEMATEKYLLRSEAEWKGRLEAMRLFDHIAGCLKAGDIRALGRATWDNFEGPIQTIIPWAGNLYAARLIEQAHAAFGDDFWGFWMLGGMSGGGMGFIFAPHRREEAQRRLHDIMLATKRRLEGGVPFAMDPVVYDFAINENGTTAELLDGERATLPPGYYAMTVPRLLRHAHQSLGVHDRAELDAFAESCRTRPEFSNMVHLLFDRMLPQSGADRQDRGRLEEMLERHGFDRIQHEQIRTDLRAGRIGLAQNRLPVRTKIEDVRAEDVLRMADTDGARRARWEADGLQALSEGRAAVVSLAGGAGSRWTRGAGVVKALNPFCRFAGRHRNFIEVHLAKSRRIAERCGRPVPHVVTTSYLTHRPIEAWFARRREQGAADQAWLSPGRSVGLRMIPMGRDLRFAWEEMPQQVLEEQAQKVRESLHAALIHWAEQMGEGSDYTENLPRQCLHPVGHWYEVPNLLLNGVLARLLDANPRLRHLMVHNIDTLGADLDPVLLGAHMERGCGLHAEVIARRLEDRGGGLARIDGRPRLIEGLALPREELEFDLSYYNTLTCWVDIDRLLDLMRLSRGDLADAGKVAAAVRDLAARMPTYITLKDVKKRWGRGQEDIFPVAQFEKLWGDMTALNDLDTGYFEVSRERGQQLKEPAQLDGWLRDGSAAYVDSLCAW